MISPITSSRQTTYRIKKEVRERFLSTTPRFVIDANIPAALRQSGGELTGLAKRITVYIERDAHSIQDIKDIQQESFAAANEEGASQELYNTWCSPAGLRAYNNDIIDIFGNTNNHPFITRESDEEDETALPEQEQEEIVDDADVIEDGPISSPALQALREGLITSQQFVEIEMFRH